MADINLDTLTESLRDALYVGIGATVIVFQKLQVQRQEITKAVTTQIDGAQSNAKGSMDEVSSLVDVRVKQLEKRFEGLENQFEGVLAQIEERLPEQARDLVKQARGLVGRAA